MKKEAIMSSKTAIKSKFLYLCFLLNHNGYELKLYENNGESVFI